LLVEEVELLGTPFTMMLEMVAKAAVAVEATVLVTTLERALKVVSQLDSLVFFLAVAVLILVEALVERTLVAVAVV
jgi:hypothetical protein